MLRAPIGETRYRIFLCVVALLGVVLALIATSKYGAGVSSDAARNLATADSLVEGRGFVDMIGAPLVLWPPLYPLLLACLSWLTSLSTFTIAWYLNVLLYGVNLWLAGWFLYVAFRHQPGFAAAGTLIVLLSRSMLRIHANVASEPLFETLILLFFLSAASYLDSGSPRLLWTMFVLAGLSAVQRYLGVTILGIASIVVWRREDRQTLARGLAPLLLAATPLVAWALLHNMPISGAPFGPRELGAMLPLQNIGLGLIKIMWWFIPRWGFLDWIVLHPWIVVGAILLVLLALNRRRHWNALWEAISRPIMWPSLLFGAAYFLLLAFTVVTADHLDLTSDRYYIVLLPAVVALGLACLENLVLSHVRSHRRGVALALGACFALWCIYPVSAVSGYLREAVSRGEPTNYNIANSANFREMGVIKAAERILAADPNGIVYSNYVNIVWFILGHPVQTLPFQDENLPREQRLLALQSAYREWPTQPGYIVWFTPNQYHHIVAPADLAVIADLTLLFEDETGQVFSVRPRRE